MVYVISQSGKALMPTSRHGKVKHLLREGKARVVRREPFTIQLLYDSKEYTQPVTLGVDAGTGAVAENISFCLHDNCLFVCFDRHSVLVQSYQFGCP